MLIFKLKLGMFYNATWLVSVIFVVDLRVTEFFFRLFKMDCVSLELHRTHKYFRYFWKN